MHKVAILALDEMVLLDITIPYEVFSRATNAKGKACYDVQLCGPQKKVVASGLKIEVPKPLTHLRKADTIVIPGKSDAEALLPAAVKTELLRAHSRGARLISICSGALLLAQTGLLDGKKATTHWMAAEALKRRHPKVDVDANVLYVEHPKLFTSAGGFAGMDLCLHLLRKDFGAAVATKAARLAVTPLEREGGQAQFIPNELPDSQESLEKTLVWVKSNLHKDLSVEEIAERAKMSVRTLTRQFRKQLGLSPQKWVIQARVLRARELLETTSRSIENISEMAGFRSSLSMREHFRAHVQSTPSAYRNCFNSQANA